MKVVCIFTVVLGPKIPGKNVEKMSSGCVFDWRNAIHSNKQTDGHERYRNMQGVSKRAQPSFQYLVFKTILTSLKT